MITVERSLNYTDLLRRYSVILDGNTVGKVRAGQTRELDAPPGAHTLQMRVDWCKSNTLTFQVGEGQSARFKCTGLSGGKALLAVVYILFRPGKYLTLEQVG